MMMMMMMMMIQSNHPKWCRVYLNEPTLSQVEAAIWAFLNDKSLPTCGGSLSCSTKGGSWWWDLCGSWVVLHLVVQLFSWFFQGVQSKLSKSEGVLKMEKLETSIFLHVKTPTPRFQQFRGVFRMPRCKDPGQLITSVVRWSRTYTYVDEIGDDDLWPIHAIQISHGLGGRFGWGSQSLDSSMFIPNAWP